MKKSLQIFTIVILLLTACTKNEEHPVKIERSIESQTPYVKTVIDGNKKIFTYEYKGNKLLKLTYKDLENPNKSYCEIYTYTNDLVLKIERYGIKSHQFDNKISFVYNVDGTLKGYYDNKHHKFKNFFEE